jgi:hypothetical protein
MKRVHKRNAEAAVVVGEVGTAADAAAMVAVVVEEAATAVEAGAAEIVATAAIAGKQKDRNWVRSALNECRALSFPERFLQGTSVRIRVR